MTISDRRIRQLRERAVRAGDCAVPGLCDHALGPAAVAIMFGGRRLTREDARAECERIIRERLL